MSVTRASLFLAACVATGLAAALAPPWWAAPPGVVALALLLLSPVGALDAATSSPAHRDCFLCGAPLELGPGERRRCDACGTSQIG